MLSAYSLVVPYMPGFAFTTLLEKSFIDTPIEGRPVSPTDSL